MEHNRVHTEDLQRIHLKKIFFSNTLQAFIIFTVRKKCIPSLEESYVGKIQY